MPINNTQELNNIHVLTFRGDYFLHAMLFIPWAFIRPVNKIKVFPWVVLGLVFATCSEGLQYFLPYRAYNVNDLVANMTGVLLGFVLAWIWRKVKG